jgi:hypothetical protein
VPERPDRVRTARAIVPGESMSLDARLCAPYTSTPRMKTRRTKTQARKRKPSAARARSAAKAAPKARPNLAPPELKERDFIAAAAHVLGLVIEPAWKPAIEANFATTLRLAASFMDFPLPDEAEPAPVFAA